MATTTSASAAANPEAGATTPRFPADNGTSNLSQRKDPAGGPAVLEAAEGAWHKFSKISKKTSVK